MLVDKFGFLRFLNSLKGTRGLFMGPQQAAKIGQFGQLMQVGGGIVGSLLSFGAIAGDLMPQGFHLTVKFPDRG